MATDLSTALFAEEQDPDMREMHGTGLGDRLTAFERARLEYDPTLPVYLSIEPETALYNVELSWRRGVRSRPRNIPVTAGQKAELSWGHP